MSRETRRWGYYSLIAAALLPVSALSQASQRTEALTARRYLAMCSDVIAGKQSILDKSACLAYTVGFLESAGFLTYLDKTPPRYCLPEGVSTGAVVRMAARNQMSAQQPDQPAAFLLRFTLEKEFPCPR